MQWLLCVTSHAQMHSATLRDAGWQVVVLPLGLVASRARDPDLWRAEGATAALAQAWFDVAPSAQDLERAAQAHARSGADAWASAWPARAAAACWDAQAKTLTVRRDTFGMVPLIFAPLPGGGWCVTTEPELLITLCALQPTPSPRRLGALLWLEGWDHDDADYLTGARRILPGHWITLGLDARAPLQRRTWRKDQALAIDPAAPGAALLRALDEALTTVSADPHARVAMSGGVDSPLVAARLARARGATDASPEVVWSMVCPALAPSDESPQLDALERALPVRAQRYTIAAWPLADPSFQAARWGLGPRVHAGEAYEADFFARAHDEGGVRLMVAGFFADELLLCPPALAAREALRARDWHTLATLRHHPQGRRLVAGQLAWLGAEALMLNPLIARWRAPHAALARPRSRPWLDASAWLRAPRPQDAARAAALLHQPDGARAWREAQLWGWGWEHVMRTLWRHRSQTGLTFWSPFLHPTLWDTAMRLPPSALVRWDRHGAPLDKWALRQASRAAHIPDTLAMRPRLRTFDRAIEHGLAGPGRSHALALSQQMRLAQRGLVDEGAFQQALVALLEAIDRAGPSGPFVGATIVWKTLAAEAWLRALDGDA